MINFRFHLVSLVAVFLALALGIIMGYGVLGQPTVEGLQNRIDTVEGRISSVRRENDQLHDQVDRLQGFVDDSAPFAVSGRLPATPVVMLAARGVDGDRVRDVVALARAAGGAVPGIVWLESKWALEKAVDTKELANAVGTAATGKSAVRDAGWTALSERVQQAPSVSNDVLVTLGQSGFLTAEPVGDGSNFTLANLDGLGASVIVVDGSESQIPDKSLVGPLSRAMVAASAPLVVGEVYVGSDGACHAEAGSRPSARTTPSARTSRRSTTSRSPRDASRAFSRPATLLATSSVTTATATARTVRCPSGRLHESRCEPWREAGRAPPVGSLDPGVAMRLWSRGRAAAPAAESSEVKRAATGMGAATAVSRAFGFVRILVIAAVLGTTYLGNVYQSSNSISNVLFELLAAGALSAVLVPTFVDLLDRGDQPEAERIAGRLLGLALVALSVVVVVGLVLSPLISRLLTSGVSDPHIAAQQRSLSTFLLLFFIPQVLLYAVGAIAVAVLYAQRRLAVTALAPIGLTVVVVAALGAFRALAGSDPGLSLSVAEKLTLAFGGTLGVAAFVAIPTVALWRGGGGRAPFRLVPRLARPDGSLRRLMGLSGWAAVQNSIVGVLLLAAIVVGNRVEGGTVAYQVSWIFFLAPYAVLAQPIHTAIHPDLARQTDDRPAFARSLRWALDSMAVLVVPVAAGSIALSRPIMRVAAFGHAHRVGLLSAGLATFAVGLFTYSAFLMFVRAYYSLDDSRTPAYAAGLSAVVGIGVMVGVGVVVHDAAVVAAIGIGHSLAYAVGTVLLGIGLHRRGYGPVFPRALPKVLALAVPLGCLAWWVNDVVDPHTRIETLGLLVAITLVGGALYVVGIRLLGGMPERPPHAPGAPAVPDVTDFDPADVGAEE